MKIAAIITLSLCYVELIGSIPLASRIYLTKKLKHVAKLESPTRRDHQSVAAELSMLKRYGPWQKRHLKKSENTEQTSFLKKSIHKQYSRSSEPVAVPSVTNAACEGGRQITCAQGTVASPGYPEHYYSNSNCSWHIQAPAGKVIELDFADFALPSAEDCETTDYLSIADLTSAARVPPMMLCGEDSLPKYSTVGNQALINFVSNDQDVAKGFLFNFYVRDPIPCEDTIELVSEAGTLSSENYPDHYLPNSNCHWRIVTPEGTAVTLTLTDVAVEPARSCEWDAVRYYDGALVSAPALAQYCGTDAGHTVTASGNVVLVELVSDGSGEDRGFVLTWTAE